MNEREERVAGILLQLERRGTERNRDGMARYGITTKKVFGVPVAKVREIAGRLGKDHRLALALWETGWHEARLLAAFVAEPDRLTGTEMDRWVRGFDNWAVCDTACLNLFDRARPRWRKTAQWVARTREFERRAGFALVAAIALHDPDAPDAEFRRALGWIRKAATDERNFVRKAVHWALRAIAERRPGVRAEAMALAERLAASGDATSRWIGKDALRQLARPAAKARMKRATAASRPAGSRG